VTIVVTAQLVEPVVAGLVGGIDVDDGPTERQLAVLDAVVRHLWRRPDLEVRTLPPLAPEDAAREIVDAGVRRRTIELLVLLELCRHPQTVTQIARVEEYAAALGVESHALDIIRTWIDDGTERATADYDRFYADVLPELSEPAFRGKYLHLDEPDHALARRLRAFHDLPADTLGYAYIEFYRRNRLVLPGDDTHLPAHYVSHDMNHVIAGYEPTGPGEIALGAFTLAMKDNDANWLQFMTNLLIHEGGMLKHGEIMPKAETLNRPGATELLGEALERGARCTGDFSQADHMELAPQPLAEVRARFNVTPLATPMF
jgi:ubiquinone biosynthesis protein Coq4